MRKLHVIIVDTDAKFRASAAATLRKAKYLVRTAHDLDEGAAAVGRLKGKAVVLSALSVRGRSAIPFLQDTRKKHPHVPFILVERSPDLDQVIEALHQGAYDFLRKPVGPGILCHAVGRAVERLDLSLESESQDKEIRKLLARNRSEIRKAKELSEFRGAMLATAAHDFRSVLAVLDGYHQIIKDKCRGCEAGESLDLLAQARRSVNRLQTMASTLLDCEASERGVLTIDRVRFEVGPVLAECAACYGPYAAQKDVDLGLEGEMPATLTAFGDPVRVMEVLENIIFNSVKFTPSGGRIRIGAKAGENGFSQIWVADSGQGIPKALIRRFLGEVSSAGFFNDKGRIGLGLTICRKLVKAQGGSIGIESEVGKGTKVLISLPGK